MFVQILRRLMDPQTTEGGAGASSGVESTGDTSTTESSSPAASSNVEIPDFAELAEWDESLETADEPAPAVTGSGAPTQPPAVAAVPGSSAPPVVPPPTTPPVAATPPTPPAVPAAQPPATSPEATTQPPAAAAQEPPVTIEQHRAKALPELQKLYQLSPEEVEEFTAAPHEALPKLAARLHFEVVMSAYQAIQSQLPQMVQGFMAHDRGVQEANNAFYGKWPDLKGDQHYQAVANAIKAYKAANPQATQEQLINGAGAMVMISLGKNPFAQNQQQAAPASSHAVPARPAGVGASGAPLPSSASQPANDIEAISQAWAAGDID